MAEISFEHGISYITARIAVVLDESSHKVSIGTGFICGAQLPDDTGRTVTLLVSNKHVFADPDGKLIVTFNRRRADGGPDYGNTVTFEQQGFRDAFYPHPDPEVDLACINISAITRTSAFFRHLDNNFFKPIDYSQVTAGSSVIFVGYPENRYDVINNLPLVRRGNIASLPDVDFNGRRQIVIDAQVFQGSSGSPVFAAWAGKYALLGVVSETMIRHARLQTVRTNLAAIGVQQILGLGIVLKQALVTEVLDLAANEIARHSAGT